MSALASGAFGALSLGQRHNFKSKFTGMCCRFNSINWIVGIILTVTGWWCSCELSSRICSHSAMQPQSCVQTDRPICDPKPEKKMSKMKQSSTPLLNSTIDIRFNLECQANTDFWRYLVKAAGGRIYELCQGIFPLPKVPAPESSKTCSTNHFWFVECSHY